METVLLCILSDILISLDDDKIIPTAFDTIDHEILLYKLQHDFGIHSTALNWVHLYLSDRKQNVFVLVHS